MTSTGTEQRTIITQALRKIDDLTTRLEIAEFGHTEPIAVVGMGCRFPGGAEDPRRYWKLLQEGGNGVTRVPENRWDADAFYSSDHTVPGTICTRDGGFLTSWQPDEFDADFFGISPREAAAMDPQQRLLLEVSWEALEDAGINPQQIRNSQTAVFVGSTTNDYSMKFLGALQQEEIDSYVPFGNAANFAAGRLAYFLGAHGPAVVIDTACSSSLVAVHLACESLRRHESDSALAAGVNLMLTPLNSMACSRWGMLSVDGRCKAFDADANGYVRSEGCGVVVLKRLSDALREGDPVLAVMRGSAVNQDGPSSGQTVPNGPAQQALLRRALAASRLQPADIDYIEAHGTGTALGDPIELGALSAVFEDRGESAPLILGSVKTNLGHMEAAAGVAGLIKTVLSLQHGEIPRHLNFSRLTANACEGAARFIVAAERMPWPTVARPRRAGVSSFGVSGTNAHLVIEQAPRPERVARQPEPAVSTLVVSGKSPQRIAASAAVLAEWMTGDGVEASPASVAHTLNHHRARYPLFGAVVACDREQAVAGLRALAAGHPAPGVVAPHSGVCRAGIVFVYSGQGSQWAGMGRQLLTDEPAFAAAVDDLEPDFVEHMGFSLRQTLSSDGPVEGVERVQPVLVAVQLALTALWRSYDVTPDAVIGHSMGEVTAAVVAGALTPADGLRVVATRSRLLSRLSGQGAMALLELDAAAAEEVIAEYPHCTVAVYASPRQTVIAGPPDEVEAVVKLVANRDLLARNIDVDVASHHPIVDAVLPELRRALSDLAPAPPSIPVIGTTDGTQTFDADHWVANLRNPVRFSQAVAAAGADHATFIEISPHPVLSFAVSDTLRDTHHHSLGTLFRDTHDTLTFHTNRAAAHTMRAPNTPHPKGPHTWIPTTPWQHTRHWITTPDDKSPHHETSGKPIVFAPQDVDGVPGDWLYDLQWAEVPASSRPESSSDESWLVCEDSDERHGVGAALTRVLAAPATIRTTAAIDNDDVWLRDVVDGVRNVLFAPAVPSSQMDVPSAYRLFNLLRRLAAALTQSNQPTKLFVVTRNAQPVRDGDPANPAHAVLWGLCRTLALEHPEIWGGVIDVDEAVVPDVVARFVLTELTGSGGEDQVVYRNGVRHVPRLRPRDTTVTKPVDLQPITDETSQLVIGATGGIGPRLIRQLAESGAGTIVAVSRHAGAQLTELTASLASTGTRLLEVAADCADEAAMAELFDRFGADLPPLDGIYLAALAGRPALLSEMTDDDVNQMFRPKLDAVALLHKLSLQTLASPTPVRRFVMFSSITGVLGSRWLGHYTASGAYLDAFAYWRRISGLPATVIDWGLWQTSGEHPDTTDVGLQPMDGEVAIRAMSAVTSASAPARYIVVAADWHRLAAAYRMRGKLRVIDDLLALAGDCTTVDGIQPRFGTVLGPTADNDNAGGARRWQALLMAAAKPYPGGHRIRGVELVPASVLLQTLAVAAAECTASILADIRFDYPIVIGRPRLIDVEVDGGWVTVSSRPPDADDGRNATRHISARIASRHDAVDTSVDGDVSAPVQLAAATELQRAWGIEGQPFEWSVDVWRPAPAGFDAEVSLPEASTVALLDAAVHIARLVDSANPALLVPAEVDSARFAAELTGRGGCVHVRQRPDEDGDLVVDIVATTPDGQACFEIRGLRYVDAESADADFVGDEPSVVWSQIPAADVSGVVEDKLTAILASELGMPPSAVDKGRPFPELGLNSMAAMAVLREAKQLIGAEMSPTMLWDHPTIAALSALVTELVAKQHDLSKPAAPPPDAALDGVLVGAESNRPAADSGAR